MKFEMRVIVSSFYWCCPCFKRKKKKKTDKQKSEIDVNVTFKEYSLSKEFPSEEHIMKHIGYEMNKDKPLGEGSSGIVYEITRIRDSMKMAVKRIYLTPFDNLRDQRIVTQLKTEIQTMSKVRHENIISLEDYFIISNHCYLIMELATGGSLDEEIKRTGPLSEPKAKNDFIQMVNAINYLHNEHSIAHRDIKLANFFLCEQNDQKIVKASDNRVRTGDGTVQYMSPKVLKLYLNQEYPEETKKYVGKVRSSTPTKDDIWALGVCLYEMTHGFRPFNEYQNQKLFKMLDKQINKEIQPFKEGVSYELKNLIYGMLEPDSNKRLDINGVRNHIWLS